MIATLVLLLSAPGHEISQPASVQLLPRDLERPADFVEVCLSMGKSVEGLDRATPWRREKLVKTMGRMFRALLAADFEAKLDLHRHDLAFAASSQPAKLAKLQQILKQELGVPEEKLPKEWVPALREYWARVFPQPVALSVFPESIDLRMKKIRKSQMTEQADWSKRWRADLEEEISLRKQAIPALQGHTFGDAHLVFPHRRSIEEIAAESGELHWFDLQFDLSFKEPEGLTAPVFLRFVWDPKDEDWFLCRAVNFYPLVRPYRNFLLH